MVIQPSRSGPAVMVNGCKALLGHDSGNIGGRDRRIVVTVYPNVEAQRIRIIRQRAVGVAIQHPGAPV